jgi:hypothetical protein
MAKADIGLSEHPTLHGILALRPHAAPDGVTYDTSDSDSSVDPYAAHRRRMQPGHFQPEPGHFEVGSDRF